MQPEAEGTGRRLRSTGRRILSSARALAAAEADVNVDGDGAAAAEGDGAAAAEGGDAAAAEGDDGAAAEGDDGAAAGVCADFDLATLFVPGALGAGTVSNGTDEADVAVAEEPAAKRRLMGMDDLPRMPLVETEAAAVARVVMRRALLEAIAEPADDAAAEGEDAAAEGEDVAAAPAADIDFADTATLEPAAAVLSDPVSGGVCDGVFTTPAGQHPMVNQDVVFGQAREINGVQYFRIVDMFTPSRSKPQPDHVFGGTDDITDAWGAPLILACCVAATWCHLCCAH